MPDSLAKLQHNDEFISRHIGPNAQQQADMLQYLGLSQLQQLVEKTVPENIRFDAIKDIGAPCSEQLALTELKTIAEKNTVFRSYLGLGYYPTQLPLVIQRNVLENPGWYTAYTPYQPEISQGRLEALLNYQQMVMELTGMPLANASLLDEATAAAEAMAMAKRVVRKNKSTTFLVDQHCFPQTIAVLKTRAEHFGFNLVLGNVEELVHSHEFFGAYTQYPNANGEIKDIAALIAQIHQADAIAVVGSDPMALMLLQPPGTMGADIVVGSSQRFGIPMGFGGPHAAFFAFKEEYKRSSPGRIIGVSKDARGKAALRMAMQTREQHIRREKANSNICTSQVLLAVLSAFYAMYHGREGLTRIAQRIHLLCKMCHQGLQQRGLQVLNQNYFDTLTVEVGAAQQEIYQRALSRRINLRKVGSTRIALSFHECSHSDDITELLQIFTTDTARPHLQQLEQMALDRSSISAQYSRAHPPLQHPVFNQYHSETEMLRYLKRLESKDIALNHSMIPLGSCTMKLNATAEMVPVTWPAFSQMHPFAPLDQAEGYQILFRQLQSMLQACTGYDAISLQPNAGSQGEYAGLVTIKKYFASRGEQQRQICLIPASAHGTNPASAQMVSMQVKVVACDAKGNVDMADLKNKIDEYGERIAAIMITYPSTHGVFEENVRQVCEQVHSVGAQVYIDGANMNALVGLAAPGEFGGDVSHLNLHKTFCIPHGGGGPGMGPIGVKGHLAAFLPSHPLQPIADTREENGTISAAPWGSASILPISWMYIRMMGAAGLKRATEVAILNANYIARKLRDHYPILYSGAQGLIAHECLLDLRPLKESSGISEEDIAKRLMDFGFHAPTMSFPVAGTLMIEPTESETKGELDRFCAAMITIRKEATMVEQGQYPRDNNPLSNAPHSLEDILDEHWDRPYSKEYAARPLPYLRHHKLWPSVNRVDNVYGDRNLQCACPTMDAYQD